MSGTPWVNGTVLCAVACNLTSLDAVPLLCSSSSSRGGSDNDDDDDGKTGRARQQPQQQLRITEAQLSFNAISASSLGRLACLTDFLHTLILDNNDLRDVAALPRLPKLQRLWLNNNRLASLDDVLKVAARQCNALTYLSLLRNPCCPSELDGHLPAEYARYRLYVKHTLPSLVRLDSEGFTEAEAQEARKKGQFARPARAKCGVGEAWKDNNGTRSAVSGSGSNNGEQVDLFAVFDEERRDGGGAVTYLSSRRHVYTGRGSEGNRFIRDDVL
ncbi:hypothetical protein DQ04_22021000 [Trypanosoma grayi]|uniref:hypothetical protein n=1 Tax=Trypanosoma grayi TaxID=71804 RepID=UPI0004F3F171|nr:hypothetical protein DQ04_22021000 [Trypanosoma grayi]KEG05434.1 hypothetical protein DQ04_22021000 [Trypanosoma grayi]